MRHTRPKMGEAEEGPVIEPQTAKHRTGALDSMLNAGMRQGPKDHKGEREERYRALFEMGPVAVYSCDVSGVIDNFNARAAELWGRAPEPGDTDERFCGSYNLFLPDGTYMPHDECPMAQVVSGRMAEARDQEVLIERPDGSRVTVIVNIRPLTNQRGELTGAINCFYDITERKRLEEALQESHANLERTVKQRTAALRQLSSKLMRAQDDERRKISRELHDSIGQYLVHVKMLLDALRRPDSTDKDGILRDLTDTVETCLTETRTISYLLHPPLLDELGLSSAVNWYADGFAQRSGIQVNLNLRPGLQRLPSGLEILLFRFLQESLTNIHRHSHSPSVDIKLDVSADEVLLEVRDYGQGFPADLLEQFRSGAGGGVGLRSMHERVSEVEGRFEIESDSTGALVRVIVPLSEQLAKSASQVGKAFSA
jgi:PAS domain S-box-containing protein